MSCQGPVLVRRAIATNAPGIAHVYLAAWQEAHAGLVPAEFAACLRAQPHEQSWRDELEIQAADRAPWVALIDTRLVGFASGGISRDADAQHGDGEVYQVSVDPGCWRLGIGGSLLRHVVKDLHDHGFERAHLWVVAGCKPATIFMQRLAWVADGATRQADCGGAQVDEIRYRRALR
jgi:ribosomal protein S18 acetylase RimI-like enzyme